MVTKPEENSEESTTSTTSTTTANNDTDPKVSRETAKKEVESYLDYKKVKARKRENLAPQIELFEDAIMDGSLVLDPDKFVFTHTLAFPLTNAKGDITVRQLNYKPRLDVKEINSKMKGIKANDADGRVVGYISALTGQPSEILTRLDSEDNSLAQGFATFFL